MSIFYTEISNHLKKNITNNNYLNILEIGCGDKIYKKDLMPNNYEGIDLPDSKWININDKPEILKKLSVFKPQKNYDLIFSVATIYLLDKDDLKKFIELINNVKDKKGKILIFDYKKKTIDKLGTEQNNYLDILKNNFFSNFKIIDIEWCSNNKFRKKIKEFLKINKSHIIEINFTNKSQF